MRYLFLLFFIIFSQFAHCNNADSDFTLVYVHVGPELPKYLPTAISQARVFNPECPIFLLGNSQALSSYNEEQENVTKVSLESLTKSSSHQQFIRNVRLSGLWRYAIERFLYLDDFIQQYDLKNVFHTENDVMIYFDISTKLSVFMENYDGMVASVFDCDERSVPSFVFISNPTPSEAFAKFIALRSSQNTTDMALLGSFKDTYLKDLCDTLPILIPSYADDYPLTNLFKKTARSKFPYINNLSKFQMIFDAAALGQFLGGIDPILGSTRNGFVGEMSVFQTYRFQYEWEKDEEGRLVPYISYKDETYPIANLHIHCKNLKIFHSLNQEPPLVPTSFWSALPLN